MAAVVNGEHKWSESGLKLLETIKGIIHREGGRIAFAGKIMREDKDYFHAVLKRERNEIYKEAHKSRKKLAMERQDQIIIELWSDYTLEQIADELGVHFSLVGKRGKDLGLPPRTRIHHTRESTGKPVLVITPDGEKKYNSMAEAASKLNLNKGSVSRAIKKGYAVNGFRVKLAQAV